jgi:hypothetical protein
MNMTTGIVMICQSFLLYGIKATRVAKNNPDIDQSG